MSATGSRKGDAANAGKNQASGLPADLDVHNPWPGLEAYNEAASAFFFGRSEEANELLRLIRLAPLTVVYGKSGLGKTSLLQAGLFPLLRAENYLPVYVRLDFSEASRETPLQQVMTRLKQELDATKAEYPEAAGESLWEYLHRKNLEIWNARNFPVTPVLVFDQFEELFSRTGGNTSLVKKVFDDLADLIENRIPVEIAEEAARSRRSGLDILGQRYRIVLSFREDFLPEVKTWEGRVPSLLRNYLRLDPMSRQHAIDAVESAGKAVLEEGVAPYVVDFVGNLDRTTGATDPSPASIEPVLLSLCCYQLNRRRASGGKIDKALIDEAGQDILDSFYNEALADPEVQGPPDAAAFIEDHLVQGDRFRGDYPKEEALHEGKITARQLAALTDRHRLLRVVQRSDTARVELIHDRLVPVVRKARDERRIKLRHDEQERQAKEAQAERDLERARSEELQRQRDAVKVSLKGARRSRNVAVAAAVISVLVIVWGAGEQKQKESARLETERAVLSGTVGVETARLAEGRLALKVGQEPLEQAMYRGLAAYRLTEQGMSQAMPSSLAALHYGLEASVHLRKAVTISGLVPTPAVAYSPTGKSLAVGGEDGHIRLLDTTTYLNSGQLDCGAPTSESVWALTFNKSGTRLAAGYADNADHGTGLVCVFDVAQRKILRKWSATEALGKRGDIFSVAYADTATQDLVLSAGREVEADNSERGVLRVLNVESGETREVFFKTDAVAVAVSEDRETVVEGGEDADIYLWKLQDLGKPSAQPRQLKGHKATIQQVAFSPADPTTVVSTGDDGRIMVWNTTKNCLSQQSTAQPARLYGIAVSPDGLVGGAGADGVVRLFRPAKETPCLTASKSKEFDVIPDGQLSGHGGLVLGMAFNEDGSRLASVGQDGSIRIWGPNTPGFSLAELNSKGLSITSVAISPDSKTIIAGDREGRIHLWDRPTNSEPLTLDAAAQWSAHPRAITALIYVQAGNRSILISGSDDGTLQRWDPVTRTRFGSEMKDDASPIRSLAASQDGKVLAAGSRNGIVRLWDPTTGELKQKIEKPQDTADDYDPQSVAFSQDGEGLAIGSNYGGVRVVDLKNYPSERTLQGPGGTVYALASSKSQWLLSADSDGIVLEWEQAALRRPQAKGLKKHDEFKFRLGFRDLKPLKVMAASADGTLILTGGDKGLIQLWDGIERVLIGKQFLGHGNQDISAIAMAPDNSFFVTADSSTILLWPGPSRWAGIICSKLASNMSVSQWREWVSPKIPYREQCPGLPIAP